MTGSDPSEKTDEIDLTGVDLSAGLDLELRAERPAVSSPSLDRTQVARAASEESAQAGTVVDLALDLLAPTRMLSVDEESSANEDFVSDGLEGGQSLEATVVISSPLTAESPVVAATGSENFPLQASVASSAIQAASEAAVAVRASIPAPAPPAAERDSDAWGEVASWLARLDRLIGAQTAGAGRLSMSAMEEASTEQPKLEEEVPGLIAEWPESEGAWNGRDGIDQAIAFLEAGSRESARKALLLARGSDPGLAAQCDALLAALALEERRPHEALRICEEWRTRSDLSEDERREFRYQSARSLEALGRMAEARGEYRALVAVAPGYRDCALRLHRLGGSS